jgi:hypothetical protein
MSLVISKVFTYDTDAGNYIQAVEAADGQALEGATRQAINDFVVGCKQDGIWSAIKASCILAGARTLNGALAPLVGTAPTNNNFVSADYNRKTGLVGNGSTKYLNSNRASNSDPQNNKHASVYISTPASLTSFYFADDNSTGINLSASTTDCFTRFNSDSGSQITTSGSPNAGLTGLSRGSSSFYVLRKSSANTSIANNSISPSSFALSIYSRTNNPTFYSNARLAFYSIGESLDLALLDARVSALITAFGVAIP